MKSILPTLKKDYWTDCGYEFLDVNGSGQLIVTDAFLQSLLQRPELIPVRTSCDSEIKLFELLCQSPRSHVDDSQLKAIKNQDVADNYAVWLRFRQRILAKPTLETSYLAIFQGEGVDVPPVLVRQLTQVLLRHVLGSSASAIEARSAEMLFRTQKITVTDEAAVLAADDETVDTLATTSGFGSIGEMLQGGGAPLKTVDLDILKEDNQEVYWERDSMFDMVISINRQQPSIKALCIIMQKWIEHFLHVKVTIQTESQIEDDQWVWHVGLDAQASGILNDLYLNREVDSDRLGSLLCLFKLEFLESTDMLQEVKGRPVYMAMALDSHKKLRLKPQNLLLNLPLALRS